MRVWMSIIATTSPAVVHEHTKATVVSSSPFPSILTACDFHLVENTSLNLDLSGVEARLGQDGHGSGRSNGNSTTISLDLAGVEELVDRE
jgi:hypothetical protein